MTNQAHRSSPAGAEPAAPARLAARPFRGEADLPALAWLLVASDAHRYGEHYTLHYFGIACEGSGLRAGWRAQLWVALTPGTVGGDDEGPAATAAAELRACALEANGGLLFHIHPTARGTTLEDAVVDWMERRASEIPRDGSVTLAARCAENDVYRQALLERRGFAPADKYLLQMTRSLTGPLSAPQTPGGYTIRRLGPDTPEQELAAFAAAYNAAMGSGSTTAQRWRERLSDPDDPPPLGLMTPDGTFGAVCVCRVYRRHNESFGLREGWIEQLGTRPELRRRGLGRAAVRAGLHLLRERGATTAVLETGSTNTRSKPLYEAEGFVTRTRIHSLRKTLRGVA